MKKLLLYLFIIVGLFTITGCGNKNIINIGKKNTFKVGDKTFKFNQDKEFLGYKYKLAEGLENDESKYANYIDYKDKDVYDGNFVFRIVMYEIEGKTLKDVEKEYKEKDYKYKTINGVKWVRFKHVTEGTEVIAYITEKNKKLYVVNLGKYEKCDAVDTEKLDEAFMSVVSLK